MKTAEVRIDKWLWAVRIFKTRSQAAEACKKGRIYINDEEIKASRAVKLHDIVEVKKPPITYRYKVKELLARRVGAKLVENYIEDITPEQEIIKFDMMRLNLEGYRDRGAGRPTKKERRILDKWQDEGDE
ncbi:MAG: RNA-binding S4 domain-containing protein [Salinivirgaceae bacterium]|nr:RNA-binding S4 domain-containing protein [Salinivirgaceae bacterium]